MLSNFHDKLNTTESSPLSPEDRNVAKLRSPSETFLEYRLATSTVMSLGFSCKSMLKMALNYFIDGLCKLTAQKQEGVNVRFPPRPIAESTFDASPVSKKLVVQSKLGWVLPFVPMINQERRNVQTQP